MDYDVIRAIEERFSVRSFTKRPMPRHLVKAIDDYATELNRQLGPFGTQPRIEMASAHFGEKPMGTYGVIKNATEFFVGICQKNRKAVIDLGYNLEKMILFVTARGLGTCWMAGTFKRGDFERQIPLEEGEYIPAVSPVGYSHEKVSLLDKSLRFVVQSTKRKGWGVLFFDRNMKPLSFNSYHHEMKIPLEMVRLAPSGKNSQPWRVVICEEDHCAHFFSAGSFTHLMDLGIAMAHFELALKAKGYSGIWHETPNPIDNDFEYILTFHWQK